MKTKIINLLSFDELNAEQKDQVIKNYQDINTSYNWEFFTLDNWKERLERQGFENATINYTGFWSQGDGASFNCQVNLEQFLKGRRIAAKYAKELKRYKDEGFNISITNQGHYCHEYTMAIDSDYLENEQLEAFILEEAREQARKIYRELEKEYYQLSSDAEVAETLRSNEYFFNEETLKIDN